MSIGELLSGLLNDEISEHESTSLIHYAHSLARKYFESKNRLWILSRFSVETSSDFAWDAIAQLFERDDLYIFSRLKENLNKLIVSNGQSSQVDLTIFFRKIIYQAVNDELFAHYRETDPTLSKIIRNIKDHIHSDKNFEIQKKGSRKFIQFNNLDPSQNDLIQIEPEILSIKLISKLNGITTLTTAVFLDQLKTILQEENNYAPFIEITNLALVIRGVLVLKNIILDEFSDTTSEIDHLITVDELQFFISQSRKYMDNRYKPKYVESGKISMELWDLYLKSIEELIQDTYGLETSVGISYFESLSHQIPSLEMSEYLINHKSQFEYLNSLFRNHFLHSIKKEIQFGNSGKS